MKTGYKMDCLKKLHDKREDGVKLNRTDRRALKKLERQVGITNKKGN